LAEIENPPSTPSVTAEPGCAPSSITLIASGGEQGNYRWYEQPTGGNFIPEVTGSTFATPILAQTTIYYVSTLNGICESQRAEAIATINGPCTQEPPTITAQQLITVAGGTITLDLLPLIAVTDHALDINSIVITQPPLSGASVFVVNGLLTISYAGIAFTGTEAIMIQACDVSGNCAEQQFTIEVAGDIIVYNAVSPNGTNPTFIIKNIDLLPDTQTNHVMIYDRWQNEVWQGVNYDNSTVVFNGVNNKGGDLPTGTYYYKIEFNSGRKMQTGFISLKR
jgi:gliding motility-associated-like protein